MELLNCRFVNRVAGGQWESKVVLYIRKYSMNNKSTLVTSAADACGQPSSIRLMDKPNCSNREQKESFMLSNRSSVSRGCSLAAAAFAVFAVLGAGMQVAQASLLVYEPFNYTAGSNLDGQGNANDIGFSNSSWLNGGTSGNNVLNSIVSPGLSYTDTSGNTLQVLGNALLLSGDESSYRNLSATYGTAGQTIWISMIGRGGSTNSYAGLSLINTALQYSGDTLNAETMFVGQPSSTNWGFAADNVTSGSGSGTTDSGVAASDQAFLVYELVVGSNTQSVDINGTPTSFGVGYTINMWVNPTLGTSLSTTPNASFTDTNDPFYQFNQFVLHAGYSGPLLDELRIGTNYADVAPIASPVPEPTTISLLGIGILALAVGMSLRKRYSLR